MNFWIQTLTDNPEINNRSLKYIMPFATTYLCEKMISLYIATKNKYRNKLDAEHDMSLQITSIVPDIKLLCTKKQGHKIHYIF